MNEYDVRRFGRLLSVQANIEAMKADNQIRLLNGGVPLYGIVDFQTQAEELERLAHCHDHEL